MSVIERDEFNWRDWMLRQVPTASTVGTARKTIERVMSEVVGQEQQLQGAVKDHDDLRETIQNILDAGYHYAEEYRWSLQEALDPPAPEGGQS